MTNKRVYRGKYPRRIFSTASVGRGTTSVELNNGERFSFANSDLVKAGYIHSAPKPGTEIDTVFDAVSTVFNERKKNPATRRKSAAISGRVGLSRKGYVSRPSQAAPHKAPTKRLQVRRKAALIAPKGFYPNPTKATRKIASVFMLQSSSDSGLTWDAVANFNNKIHAFTAAKSLAAANKSKAWRVVKK